MQIPAPPDVGGKTISQPEVVTSVKVPLFGAKSQVWNDLAKEKIARQKAVLEKV